MVRMLLVVKMTNNTEKIKQLKTEMGRAGCEMKGIILHQNGRVSATFHDLMSKKKGWTRNTTTSHKSFKSAMQYFGEIGDYIEKKGLFAEV